MKKSLHGIWIAAARHARPLLGGAGAALLLLVVGFLFWQQSARPESSPVAVEPTPVSAAPAWPEGYVRRLTDGMPVPPDQQPKRWFAVMVENSADAWPLSGLSQARLVIEAPVEGSIPRFSAYFDDTQDEVKKIGPVRSLRPYYLDWAQGFGAMVAHVGGSPEALAAVDARRAMSLNEFFWGRFFWRSLDRYAPHNVYTSVGLLEQGFEARGFEDVALPAFTYTDQEPAFEARAEQQRVRIPFSSLNDQYDAVWVYDREMNQYKREQGDEGATMDVENDEQIQAKNIVIMYANVSVIDDIGRRAIKTIGEGEMTLLRDGQSFDGVWKKEGRDEPLRFLSDGGGAMALNAGITWIEVVPLSTTVE